MPVDFEDDRARVHGVRVEVEHGLVAAVHDQAGGFGNARAETAPMSLPLAVVVLTPAPVRRVSVPAEALQGPVCSPEPSWADGVGRLYAGGVGVSCVRYIAWTSSSSWTVGPTTAMPRASMERQFNV